jgi:iron only hydrogenase large subunit-like protein
MNGGGEGVVKRIFRRRHLFPHELMPVAAVEGLSCFKQSCVGGCGETDTRRRRHKKKKTQEEEDTRRRRNEKKQEGKNHKQP